MSKEDLCGLTEDQIKLISRLAAEMSLEMEMPKILLMERIRVNGVIGYKINDDGSVSLKYSENAKIQLEVLNNSLKDGTKFSIERATDIVLGKLNKP